MGGKTPLIQHRTARIMPSLQACKAKGDGLEADHDAEPSVSAHSRMLAPAQPSKATDLICAHIGLPGTTPSWSQDRRVMRDSNGVPAASRRTST